MSQIAARTRRAMASLVLCAAAGCGGVDESNFSETPGQASPDAPTTPADYDARYPLADGSGGQPAEP